uniref:KIB1-4 beta-propeller domain-containing protein n=1 Tax=Oryza punctata TaxID=4537 RepID=A0A0E0LQ16_ORYPU
MYANPFSGDMFEFPEVSFPAGNQFDGICLSATPTSHDCIAFSISKGLNHSVYITLWRAGDEQWTMERIEDHTPFRTAYCNPVGLAVFNPKNTTWRVLDKPEPVLDDNVGDPMPGDMCCHLLEFMGDLIAIFRPHNDEAMNRCEMAWTKLERLDGVVLFVDNWNAIMMPAPRDIACNRIYLPKFGV